MRPRLLTALLIVSDLLTSAGVWTLFYLYRVINVEKSDIIFKGSFFTALLAVPLFWLVLYTLQGTYSRPERNFRLKTIKTTAIASVAGTILVFFAFFLNDFVASYQQYYSLFLFYLLLHSALTLFPRLFIVTLHAKRIHSGKSGFRTIIIGGSDKAVEIFEEISKLKKRSGHLFIGYVNINGADLKLNGKMDYLGHIDDLDAILTKNQPEEVIIALESSDHERLKGIMTRLAGYDVKINLVPDAYDLLAGQIKMTNLFGALLIDADPNFMPEWQRILKRAIDVVISLIAMVVLLPLYIFLALLVKIGSKGPVFFTQERVGQLRKPFRILKFRTMVDQAEKNGPQLSSAEDPRITKIGRFLRKTRLDEFPQFWNVLRGDMSLVGPRPERQYYIDLIAGKDPQYLYLHKVRPGITSWGQVKFGYAENVAQMIQRMKYDLLYVRNMSLALDFKIMFYTIAIIFKGSGK